MLTNCLCLVMGIISVYAHNRTISMGDRTARVIGMSGKILIFKGFDEMDSVTLGYNDLSENIPCEKLVESHYFNNFSVLHFSYSNVTNMSYPDSSLIVSNFNARHNFSVPNSNGSWPWAVSYLDIFTSNGIVNFNGENRAVKVGDTKVTFSIVNWPFGVKSSNCTELNETYLNFSVLVQGKNKPTKNGMNYDFGYGTSVTFSNQVQYENGTLASDLTNGYPIESTTDSGTVFLFRFENFSSSVLYSALVVLGPDFVAESSGVFAKIKVKPAILEIVPRDSYLTSPQYKIMMTLQQLQEVATDGMNLPDDGHKTNFANQDFSISNASYEYNADTSLGGIRVTAETNLTNNAKFNLSLFVFNASGNFGNNNVNTSVKAGNVNVTIDISGWPFCPSCSGMTGGYLDMYIDVNGTLAAVNVTTNSDKQNTFFHGSGRIVLSKQVKVDGVFNDMPNGYPKLNTVGGRDIYVLRFPKFANNIQYGLVIKLNATDPFTPLTTAAPNTSTTAAPNTITIAAPNTSTTPTASTSSQVILLIACFFRNYLF